MRITFAFDGAQVPKSRDGAEGRRAMTGSGGTRVFRIVDRSDTVVLSDWRSRSPRLQRLWPEDAEIATWFGTQIERGRVQKIVLQSEDLPLRLLFVLNPS